MSVIFDGMDQAKTAIPAQARSSKTLDGCHKHPVHVMGIMTHGSDVPAEVLVSDTSVPSDTNYVITILCLTIMAYATRNGFLPSVLYIQADSASENKSKNFLLFLAVLVGLRIFDKIKLCYLPVGHTHEDIDQMFSRFAVALAKCAVLTYEGLISIMKKAFHFEDKPLDVKRLYNTWDFGAWMEDYMPKKFEGITESMCFKFTRDDEDGVVLLHARSAMSTSKRSEPDCWFPEDGYKLITYADAEKLKTKPLTQIALRPVDLGPLKATVEKYQKEGAMSAKDVETWETEFERLDEVYDVACDECIELRSQETKTNTVKTDTNDEVNEKKRKRNDIHKAMKQHFDNEPDSMFHVYTDVSKLLPFGLECKESGVDGVLSNSNNQPVEAVEAADDEGDEQDDILLSLAGNWGASRHKKGDGILPRDSRKLIVGSVPIQWRVNLAPVAVGDMVAFRWEEAPDAGDDPAATVNQLGVARIVTIHAEDDHYRVQWFGTKSGGANMKLCTGLYPGYYTKGKRGELMQSYTATPSSSDETMVDDLTLGPASLIVHGFQLTPKQCKLPNKIAARICAIAALPHKLSKHGAECKCTHE